MWSRRKIYWRQRNITRVDYVKLARDSKANYVQFDRDVSVRYQYFSGDKKCFLSKILHAVKYCTMGSLNVLKDVVMNPRLPLLIGPQFSSDPSADGPDKENQDKVPINEESCSSDTKYDLGESRPLTPTKPRGMGKQKYKNLVRLHRKQYPKVLSQRPLPVQKKPTKKKSKAQRDRERAALMIKRCV